PSGKRDRERFVAGLAVSTAAGEGKRLYHLVQPVQQNPENGFDFTLPTERGPENLELLEIAPLPGTASAFPRGSGIVRVRGRGAWVADRIAAKAQKYGLPQTVPVHLLIYPTHGMFRLNGLELRCIAYDCKEGGLGFKTIIYLDIRGDGSGELGYLFPVGPEAL